MALSDDRGVLVDTYWQSGSEAHVLNAVELTTIEHLFWMDDYRELDRYHRGTPAEWETYAETDRQRVTSQHGLQARYFIRLGAQPDLPTQIENARAALRDAVERQRSAERRVDDAGRRLDDLLAQLRNREATAP